ncbi:hypothetical protein [Noviherbaspirillum pedocola]|uniref:Uncharacterized protein n=1 Tax=Noviherbaspirillum pedocola TaxID=2801341 RepID=A0A934W6B6_9BURK|nr:hypothetical protein [Noviherbaspirillum pedocola]MBK4736017.1 hypothetical protein [Noviherbaspirillum pedocola]
MAKKTIEQAERAFEDSVRDSFLRDRELRALQTAAQEALAALYARQDELVRQAKAEQYITGSTNLEDWLASIRMRVELPRL